MAAERRFLDTGILVACFAEVDHRRRGLARELVRAALADQQGVISPQVVTEFLREARERFEHPMSAAQAQAYLRTVLQPLCQVAWSAEQEHEALDLAERHALVLGDARVLAAARRGECRILYTDGALAGRSFYTLRAVDPFA